MDTSRHAEDDDLIRRANAAYLRTGGFDQPSNNSYVRELDDRLYVVLVNANGVLAVYRVRPIDGVLRRMKRWPKQIEEW